jgi:predicted protein tyrosine phosphatase
LFTQSRVMSNAQGKTMSVSEIKIEVVSRLEAGQILCSPGRCAEITYLVSIGDPYDPLPEGYENAERKLRLLIADVVTEEGATEEDIRRIIELAEQLRSESGTLLIHCEAGVSRSTATALIIHAYWLGQGREDEAMQRVIAQRPYAIPNRRMVALADKVLALDGRLLLARHNWLVSPDYSDYDNNQF